ncbi:hypothetical protein DV736_g1949, partial [Chaetothyriales sp. CBS 134916]
MLELTSACLEPAAQLLARRLSLPVRSSRLLQPRFWRNEGHALQAASWWPVYLESISQISQRPTRFHVAKNAPKAEPANAQHGSRAFSHSSWAANASSELGIDDEHICGLKQELQQRPQDEVLETWQPAVLAQQDDLEPVDPDVEHLQNLLGPDPKPDLAQRRRDKAWDIWVSLPDQERFASQVLRKLSQAKDASGLDHAKQAYSIIPQDERTADDYASAISVDISRHRYAQAFEICNESVEGGKGLEPAQTLLLCCLRQRLWKNAARAWRSFFVDKRHNDLDWSVLDNDPDLVSLATRLLKRLNAADVVLAADLPTLRQLASLLVTRIASSASVMAVITQEGILQVYNLSKAIGISKPAHFALALSNLCHTLRDGLRVDLALLIYGSFRSTFPKLSEGVFIGLLRLCSQAKSEPETFDYIMKQYREFHVPQTKAYNIVMMSMAREANVHEVERYFDDYKQTTGRPVGFPVLVPRLYVHAIAGDVAQTKSGLAQIRNEYGLEPDIVCWNILLYAHCRSPEPHGAFGAFDEMISLGVQPDAYTFCTLTAIASNSGDTSRVLSLLDLASQYGVSRHGVMIASVVHSLCLNGRGQEAWDFAEQATRTGVNGSPVRMWNNLLRHYAFLTDEKAVAKIQKTMQRLGVKPDAMTYAALMTALVRNAKTADALRLLRRAHLKGQVVANAFHYSILIHGFSMEKNRDMVLTLYKEMEDRFPRVSPSARLAMLYSQVHRDWDNSVQKLVTCPTLPNTTLSLPNVQAVVKDNILDTSIADMVTKEPQPGFRRRSPQSALSSISTEVLIDTFMADAQVERSVHVMNTVLPTLQRSQSAISSRPDSVDLLTARMFVATHKHDWRAVDTIWSSILTSAVKKGLAFNAPPQLLAEMHSFQNSGANVQQFCDKYKGLLAMHGLVILPANRFILSRPLSRYIQALELQPDLSGRLQHLINSLVACGFELSSKNWNSAVQALCKSSFEHDHLMAFEMFHEKFLTHLPTYRNLFSSTYANPIQIARGKQADVAKRKVTEQTNPGVLIPTYFTVVYLASTLRKSFARGNKDFVSKVSARFPQTYQYVNRLPYKPDRVQGVLLRGKSGLGNPIKRPRDATFVDVAGVAGSRATIDQVSSDVLDEIRTKLSELKENHLINDASALEIGSACKGEPVLGKKVLPGVNREESEASQRLRLKKERADRVCAAERLVHDLNLNRLTGNDYIGDPSHVSKPATRTHEDRHRPELPSDQPPADLSTISTAPLVSMDKRSLAELDVDLHLDQAPLSKTTISMPRQGHLQSRRSLLISTLRPRNPRRLTSASRRRWRARREGENRNLAIFRANERARFMAALKVRKAARRLRQIMPRIRDLTFQARIARKQGDHARAEQFLKWAADPIFEWNRHLRSASQNKRIWQVLETYVPGFHDANDRFALKTVDRLVQRPGAALTGGMPHLADTLYLRPETPGASVEQHMEEDKQQSRQERTWRRNHDKLLSRRPSVAKRVRIRETQPQAEKTTTTASTTTTSSKEEEDGEPSSQFDPWGSTMAEKFAVLDDDRTVTTTAGPAETQSWRGTGHA